MSEQPAIPDPPDDDKVGLFYRASNGWDYANLAVPPEDTITDPRERELCRALLVRALALLDAGPVRPGEEPIVLSPGQVPPEVARRYPPDFIERINQPRQRPGEEPT